MPNFFDQFDSSGGGSSIDPRSRDLAIRTIYGEAGDQPDIGKAAVAAVISNRAASGKYGGKDVAGVVTAPNQFEPWQRPDARQKMLALTPDSPDYQKIAAIFDGVINKDIEDPTNGATHFFSPGAQAALGRKPPSWAQGEGQQIGGHMFFAPDERKPANSSPAKPEARNFFDQFDQSAPAVEPSPALSPNGLRRVYIGGDPTTATAEPPKAAPGDRGALDAAARGAAQGFTANFGDEIRGLVEASGANPDDPASVYKLISGALKYFGGDAKAKESYDTAVARERDLNKTAEEQHPVASTVGNIGGAVLLPVGAAAGAATLPGRIATGAGVGAVLGGASGAGEGQGAADTLSKAAIGAGVGGVVGGAAVPVVAGIGRAISKAGEMFTPIGNLIRGATNVDEQAARNIANARLRDARGGNINGMTQAEADAARAHGAPIINADVGGENVRALARSAANTSGEGRAALDAVIGDRYRTQAPRTASWMKNQFDFPDTQGAIDRLQEAARRTNRPAYAKAYGEGHAIWDDGLEQLSQAPVMQKAIQLAFVTGRNRAALDGFAPIKNPFVLNRSTGYLEKDPNAIPNLQFWDHVKRNLDKLGPEGETFSRALRSHLDEIVPSYGTARAGAAKFFGAEDALDAGAKFATMSGLDAVKIGEARKVLESFNPAERKLFNTGFTANLIAKVEALKDGQDVVKNIFNSEFARKQIQLVLGESGAAKLEAHLLVERAIDRIRPAVQGNSTTTRQLLEAGIAGATSPTALATAAGGISSYSTGNVGPGDALLAGLTFAGRKGKLRIDENVARRVAQMLASDNPSAIQAATTVVSKTPWLINLFRKLELPAARSAGAIHSDLPAIQAAAVSRAQEQQPNVPRPPGQ